MIPKIPLQRQHSSPGKPFNDLVSYIEENKGLQKHQFLSTNLHKLLDYALAKTDKETHEEKCIAIRVHGINKLETAVMEMNEVSQRNTRCKDPAFHFILSWPEHEQPASSDIFDAAEHAIKSLGLAEHQYVLAVHGNTDNIHCHIAVNRIHPDTYHSHHIEWAINTLHLAARESELKHGWTHDNGIYIVEVDENNRKKIVLNKEFADSFDEHASAKIKSIPAWHDPDGLESWLKTDLTRQLKKTLPNIAGWEDLHTWLSQHNITLSDSGGGGMRLRATSSDSGEIVELPASKGLRILKRNELEKRWGKFTKKSVVPTVVPDLSHLTQKQIMKGVSHVLAIGFDNGIPPPHHVLYPSSDRGRQATEGAGGLHAMPVGGLDDGRSNPEVLLPNTLSVHMGNQQAGHDQDLRRPGSSNESRKVNRDNSLRAVRKEQRAAARAELRSRFAQYKQFARAGDAVVFAKLKALRIAHRDSVNDLRAKSRLAKTEAKLKMGRVGSPIAILAIDANTLRKKLELDSAYDSEARALRSTRLLPLGWRTWLYEQANLGDQAALAALRGIVYQAQRDAKRISEIPAEDPADHEQQYQAIMARLLEEEKKELAIRSAKLDEVRPYEVDALLALYAGTRWHVTGNGNVEFSDQSGLHLFTDRGNRVTFDKHSVSDDEIRLALAHAEQKFGKRLTLTGSDPVFMARMARLADDMGLAILNPEMQSVIEEYRSERVPARSELHINPNPVLEATDTLVLDTPDVLRQRVLAIDPHAEFITPNLDEINTYSGAAIVAIESTGNQPAGFAQHLGHSRYALHPTMPPGGHENQSVVVKYKNGKVVAELQPRLKGSKEI